MVAGIGSMTGNEQRLQMAQEALARGDVASAEGILRRLLRSAHASPIAWYYLGACYFQHRRFGEAEAALRRSLDVKGEYFEALHELGRSLHEQGRFDEAVAAYGRALALNGRSFEALHNLGMSLAAAQRLEDALGRYDEALQHNPQHALTWHTRGDVLRLLDRPEEALASYGKALALQPDFPEAKANEAIVRLALGQWDLGWRAFEARWRAAGGLRKRHTDIPAWEGERPIDGTTILAWCEQGLGDTLQFCRYARLLMDEGAKVVLEVQPALKALLSASLDCPVFARDDPIPPCDLQVPLMSLPGHFGTTPATVPAHVPYLRAESERTGFWKDRLQRRDGRPRVAIACSGRAGHAFDMRRQVALEHFAPLAQWAHLYLVQKELRDEDRPAFERSGGAMEFLGGEITDFQDSAAIVANLDLVISVDTSLVHLAGALGKSVWVLLADVPDWRWLRERTDSAWYPTARLFRQERPGDWAGVMARVEAALKEVIAVGWAP